MSCSLPALAYLVPFAQYFTDFEALYAIFTSRFIVVVQAKRRRSEGPQQHKTCMKLHASKFTAS